MLRLNRSRAADSGWTFVEAIVVIAIIIVLSGTVAVSASGYVERARVAAARGQVSAIAIALSAYQLDTGGYPTPAQGLDALWNEPHLYPVPAGWSGPYVAGPIGLDPWGTAYEYTRPGPGGLPFEVVSLGADRLPGGSGADADVGSARSGDRVP